MRLVQIQRIAISNARRRAYMQQRAILGLKVLKLKLYACFNRC